MVDEIDVISASLTPFPMVLHRTSRFTVVGDLDLAVVILLVAKILTVNLFGLFLSSVFASVFIYWFMFRTYYDIRYFKKERLILMPPNADDRILLHELLHVNLGQIRRPHFVFETGRAKQNPTVAHGS